MEAHNSLNIVYNVYAKLLATCLQLFLPHIVYKTQTSFIQKRCIFYNNFMFWDMIAIAQETKQELAMLLLDFEFKHMTESIEISYTKLWTV